MYYGTRAALPLYLVDRLGWSEPGAVSLISYWIAFTYLSPMLGGYLADSVWGRYKTIIRFNVVYLLGAVVLATTAYGDGVLASAGCYAGLALVAVGTGGIKSNVAPFGADQITDAMETTSYFFVFYQTINVGSLLSYVAVPAMRANLGFGPAFTLLASMLVVSISVFLLGRNQYIHKQPQGSVLSVAWRVVDAACCRRKGASNRSTGGADSATANVRAFEQMPLIGSSSPNSRAAKAAAAAAASQGGGISDGGLVDGDDQLSLPPSASSSAATAGSASLPGVRAPAASPRASDQQLTGTWLDRARGVVPDADILNLAAVMRLLPIYSMLPFFWAVYDSYSAMWILQARKMDRCFDFGSLGSVCLEPENMQVANPFLVVTMIPVFDRVLIRGLYRSKHTWLHPTPLRRMTVGMFLAGLSWVCSGLLEAAIDNAGTGRVHVAFQLLQYVVITTAELCVSTTGVEFSYREAPASMKGVVLALWYLCSFAGDLLNGIVYGTLGDVMSTQQLIWMFSGLMFTAACVFTFLASRYVPANPLEAQPQTPTLKPADGSAGSGGLLGGKKYQTADTDGAFEQRASFIENDEDGVTRPRHHVELAVNAPS